MKQRRFLALIAAVLMLLMSVSLPGPLNMVRETEASSATADPTEKDYATQGRCGDKLYWEFNTYTGELTITGSGPMYDKYPENTENPSCFAAFAGSIRSVSLPKGITSIGAYAFYNCTSLTGITLPGKVKTIGERAFNGCASLMSITLPASLVQIGPHAFGGCQKLDHVYYQGSTDKGVKLTIFAGNYWVQNATWHYTKISTARLSIKTQPKNIRVDEGKVAAFKVKAAGAVRIEWQYQPAGSSNWYDMQIIGDTCTVLGSSLYDGYAYRCKVSSGTSSMYSSPATLTVKLVDLAVKTQPKTVNTAAYKDVTFRVKAAGATHLTWQCMWPGDSVWQNMAYDTETFTFRNVQLSDNDVSVRCLISNDRGDIRYSNTAKLYLKLAVLTQPQSVTVGEGTVTQFSVSASGATGYQWEFKYPGGKWYTWTGVTGDHFFITGLFEYDGLSFRCRVYNPTGYKYSKEAKLTVRSTATYRALLIGESDYSENALPGCVYNASTMAGMLQGLTNSYTTTVLRNATKKQIINGIRSAFAGATDKDVSLFFYSGHGYQASSTSYLGALCPIDYDGITFAELASELNNVKGRVIVILDSCHSGAAIGKGTDDEGAQDLLDDYNQAAIDAFAGYRLEAGGGEAEKWGELAASKFVVMTAASYSEECWNTLYWSIYGSSGYSQGLFSAALLKGMGCKYPNGSYSGSMPADSNRDKLVTLDEIYTYAKNQAYNWTVEMRWPRQNAKVYGNLNEILFRRK